MKLFGTDGIRGTANIAPMTADIALKVGMAAGQHFMRGTHRHRAVIAKASQIAPEARLRSIGAIHLATALLLPEPVSMITLDQRLKAAIMMVGVVVSAN